MLVVPGRAFPQASDNGLQLHEYIYHAGASGGSGVCMDVWNPVSQWIPEGLLVLMCCCAAGGRAFSAWSPGLCDGRASLPRSGSWAEIPMLMLKILLIFEILLSRALSTLSRNEKDMLESYTYSFLLEKKKKKKKQH